MRPAAVEELEARLADARRRVRGALVKGAVARGVSRGAVVLLAGAIGVVLAVPVWGMAGAGAAWAVWVALCAAGVLGALVCVVSAVVSVRAPGWAEVAERVDLALGDHNRIATAYDLAERRASSVFAAGAIDEGLSEARSVGARPVVLPDVTWRGRRDWGMVAVAVVLYGVAAWGTRWTGSAPIGAVAENDSYLSGVDRTESPASRPASQPTARENESKVRRDSRAGVTTRSAVVGRAAADGHAASGSGEGMASGPSGASVKSSDAARPPEGLGGERAKENGGARKDAGAAAGGASQGASGAIGERSESGGRGGGQSAGELPAQANDVTPTAVARPEQQAVESEAQVATAGQDAGNQYNAGAAPLRQDRGQPVSRELGQGGTDGGGGSGRGGPGEGKKARGAGAVFLSVPMPDFVPGKMSAGASRVERRMIPPQPGSEGEQPGPAEVAERSVDEGVIRRFDPGPEGAAAVVRYFEEVHRRTAPAADGTGKGASSN